eukprot:233650-Chlamydomonas_euryale.AAC.1
MCVADRPSDAPANLLHSITWLQPLGGTKPLSRWEARKVGRRTDAARSPGCSRPTVYRPATSAAHDASCNHANADNLDQGLVHVMESEGKGWWQAAPLGGHKND